jgi:hypothetical protein
MGRSISRFFDQIGHGFLVSIVFLLRNWLPLILSLLAGIGISFISRSVFPPVYRADVVLRTNVIPAAELISFVNKLHVYCTEENTEMLASSLSLTKEKAKEIYDIRAYWIIDRNGDGMADFVDYRNNHSVYDTTDVRMQDRIDVRIKAGLSQDLISVRSGILRFIENDSLFRERNRVRLLQNQELLTRLAYDIKQLDSLQKVKYFEETRNNIPKTGGQIVFLQEQKTQLVYTDIYDLYARKQSLESQRLLYKDVVTIISDLTIPFKPVTRTLYYGVVFVPAFFFLTLLILIMVHNRKRLKDIYQTY